MIDKEALKAFAENALAPLEGYVVRLAVSPDNDIQLEVDSTKGLTIEDCENLSRKIEAEFDRDKEDYSLEVGTPSLTDPFLDRRQYLKHIDDEVEVLADGKKHRGILTEAGPETFTILEERKVKPEGAKRPVIEQVPLSFPYDKVTYTKYLLKF